MRAQIAIESPIAGLIQIPSTVAVPVRPAAAVPAAMSVGLCGIDRD